MRRNKRAWFELLKVCGLRGIGRRGNHEEAMWVITVGAKRPDFQRPDFDHVSQAVSIKDTLKTREECARF
eukprot:g9282.t1